MRSPIAIDDDLLDEIVAAASAAGVEIDAFIADALRRSLRSERPAIRLTTVGGGLQPGVNLDDRQQIFELSER